MTDLTSRFNNLLVAHLKVHRERYLRSIAYQYHVSPDLAEDLFQEAMLRTCQGLSRKNRCFETFLAGGATEDDLDNFLRRVIRNCFLEDVRRRKRKPEDPIEPRAEEEFAADDQFGADTTPNPEAQLAARQFEAAAAALPERVAVKATAADRQLLTGLIRSARVFGHAQTREEAVSFVGGFLSRSGKAMGFPPHGAVKAELCRQLALTPETLDVRVCRFKPRWFAEAREALAG